MKFLSAAHTDVGIVKNINQDAFCLKIARTPRSKIAFSVLCDGMGGLKNGELASALVVNAYSRWFETEFAEMMRQTADFNRIKSRWNEMAITLGKKILSFSQSKGISMGTTLTALLIVDNSYVIIHVGDTRVYEIKKESIKQLTRDQTVVAFELEHHKITPEQAKTDKRKNVLLQCIGASKTVIPDIYSGTVTEDTMFLLCSDGFRHEISDDEILGVLSPSINPSEQNIKQGLIDLIELNKSRKERDNITAIGIRAFN